MEKVDLKLCPFCNAPAYLTYYSGSDTIFCNECPAMMGGEESRLTKDELREHWNRRPNGNQT